MKEMKEKFKPHRNEREFDIFHLLLVNEKLICRIFRILKILISFAKYLIIKKLQYPL